MQYSPKLKRVMSKIESILKEEDLAGVVVLHEPGAAELLTRLDPSYSCASIENGNLRIKGQLVRDFGGDKKKQEESLRNTSNMLKNLGDVTGITIVGIMDASKALDEKLGATHNDLGFTSIQEQNN